MKYKPLTATVDAYQLTKDYATDSPKWVLDRIGTRLFENTIQELNSSRMLQLHVNLPIKEN
mgnify:CR=1 FL=1